MRPGTRTYPIPGYPAIFGLLATRLFTRDGYPEVPATLPQPYYPTGTRVPVGIIGTRPVPRPDFQYPSRPATRHFATRRITTANRGLANPRKQNVSSLEKVSFALNRRVMQGTDQFIACPNAECTSFSFFTDEQYGDEYHEVVCG